MDPVEKILGKQVSGELGMKQATEHEIFRPGDMLQNKKTKITVEISCDPKDLIGAADALAVKLSDGKLMQILKKNLKDWDILTK